MRAGNTVFGIFLLFVALLLIAYQVYLWRWAKRLSGTVPPILKWLLGGIIAAIVAGMGGVVWWMVTS